ncbi:hypothetical protein [Jiella sp. M17.18]|uniref:hypothetical protein n=1 Tax=Jiella sp. M17.18 TaxID=3234247 RepID=UPI0034DF50AE
MASTDFSLPLGPALRADLDAEARRSNQPATEIAEAAIAQYLAGRKRKREAVRQALREADDGVFISEESVARWVQSWGTESELPPPDPDVLPTR